MENSQQWLSKLKKIVFLTLYVCVFLMPFGILWTCLLFKSHKGCQETLIEAKSKLKTLPWLNIMATLYGIALLILSLIPSYNFYFLTLFAFVPFGFLLMLRKPSEKPNRPYVIKMLMISLGLSILIEFKQLYFPYNREADAYEILFGLFGTVAGIYVFSKLRPKLVQWKMI